MTPTPILAAVHHKRLLAIGPALGAEILLTRLCSRTAAVRDWARRRRRSPQPPATPVRHPGRSARDPGLAGVNPGSPRRAAPTVAGPRRAGVETQRRLAPAGAPGPSEANAALRAFNQAFWVGGPRGEGFYRRHRRSIRLVSFWQTAELIEMVEDVVTSTGDPTARRALEGLWRGVVLRYGHAWTRCRTYNDDVMWMVIAALRAYRLTGGATYLALAQANFEEAVARGWSDDLGGGLWWTTARREKNACVNGPAAVAACLLFEELGDPRYLATAQRLYAWLRSRLYDAESGRVGDRVELTDGGRGVVRPDASTYNQGTFLGAADLLHQLTGEPTYKTDALRALAFTRTDLAQGGILPGEGDGGDGGGFKGIFARYAARFVRRNELDDYAAWLWRNAEAAWGRRDNRGLVPQNWAGGATDPRRGPTAWDASSAVVLLQVLTER